MWQSRTVRSQLLLIGGRSGVGKTTVAIAVHERLKGLGIRHAVIEGDYLDLAYPAPHEAFADARLAERNLAAMWANFRELGYRRLVFTNTASVLVADELAVAMGDDPAVTAVLLRADGHTVRARLNDRALGAALDQELAHSAMMAARLDRDSPRAVHRVDTDGLTPTSVARLLVSIAGWADCAPDDHRARDSMHPR